MSVVLPPLTFFCPPPRRLTLWFTPTPTRLAARTRAAPPQGIVCTSEVLWLVGRPSGRLLFLALARRWNIALSPMRVLIVFGSGNFLASSAALYRRPLLSLVTTSLLCICLPILFIIVGLNTLSWTYILFVKRWPSAYFAWYMCQLLNNWPTS